MKDLRWDLIIAFLLGINGAVVIHFGYPIVGCLMMLIGYVIVAANSL